MVNILLVSHGDLCHGMLDAYRMLVADAQNVHAVSLTLAGVGDFRMRLTRMVEDLLGQGPLLVMADLKGGTPYNEAYALYLLHEDEMRLVAGLNLPMLIEAGLSSAAEDSVDALARLALEAGSFGVAEADLATAEASSDEELF